MTLKLTLIGVEDRPPRDRLSHEFGPAGGCIGRAPDNEWVLPDPERYLSSHHARLRHHRGEFFIEDTSTNGVYLNGSSEPLGRLGPQQLRDGDTLRMGGYQMQVRLLPEKEQRLRPEESAEVSFALPPTRDADDSLDASFKLEALLGDPSLPLPDLEDTGPEPGEAVLALVPASDAPLRGERRPPQAAARPQRPAEQRLPEARPAESRQAEARAADVPVSDEAVQALCRGAGLDPASIPGDARARLLRVAGMLLREALVGVKQLDAAQRKLRADHEIDEPSGNETLGELPSLQIEELLSRLLVDHQRQKLDAVQWLRELFASARNQDAALLAALQHALAEYLPQLDKALPRVPAEDLKRFRSLTDMPAGQLPRLLNEALARAFAAEAARLKHRN